nr:MAG TPA: hypothetical protein [Caudoviricetes sp.]
MRCSFLLFIRSQGGAQNVFHTGETAGFLHLYRRAPRPCGQRGAIAAQPTRRAECPRFDKQEGYHEPQNHASRDPEPL